MVPTSSGSSSNTTQPSQDTASEVAAYFATQPQISTISYQQWWQLASNSLLQSIRDAGSSDLMIWGFKQAMDKMADGRV
jgi:hypothetical protein